MEYKIETTKGTLVVEDFTEGDSVRIWLFPKEKPNTKIEIGVTWNKELKRLGRSL